MITVCGMLKFIHVASILIYVLQRLPLLLYCLLSLVLSTFLGHMTAYVSHENTKKKYVVPRFVSGSTFSVTPSSELLLSPENVNREFSRSVLERIITSFSQFYSIIIVGEF